MLSGRVPLGRAMDILIAQARSKKTREALDSVRTAVHQGQTLSDAFAAQEGFFGSATVAAARAGEASGKLPETLGHLGRRLAEQRQLTRRLKAALVYPLAVLLLASVAVGILVTVVIPRLQGLLTSINSGPMPWPTRLILAVSEHGPLLAGVLVLTALLLPMALHFGRRKQPLWFSRQGNRIPLLGRILILGAAARAAASLGSLLEAGVPLTDALKLSGRASGSASVVAAMDATALRVSQGQKLSTALKAEGKLFPHSFAEFAAVAEETGELPELLEQIARDYEAQAQTRLSAMLSLAEPALLVGVALVVGLVVAALFMPIINLIEQLGN